MQCFSGPIHHENPYPDSAVAITDLTFEDDLVLFRPREALIDREAGRDVYLVGANKVVHWTGEDDECGKVTVPFGFITDLTSVPWFFRLFVSRAGLWLEAAVMHDYLYVAWRENPDAEPLSRYRKFADDIMFAAMEAADVGAFRKWSIYVSLRLFGGWTFRNNSDCAFGDQTDPRLVYLSGVPNVV